MKKTIIALLLLFALVLTGCGAKSQETTEPAQESTEDQEQEAAGKPKPKRPAAEAAGDEESQAAESLAKRLCGKYSFYAKAEEQYYMMDVMTFGDNLYAFCGYAMEEEDGEPCVYSFWASEFVPFDATDLKSTEADSVEVNQLRFSVMSNAGQFWDAGNEGTITLTDQGLLFEGFSGEDFLCPPSDHRLFEKDDRVEAAFPYLSEGQAKDDNLQGYWVQQDAEVPLYLHFDGGNLFLYRKGSSQEVYFGGGSYSIEDGTISYQASFLGSGGMPYEWDIHYETDGVSLLIHTDESLAPDMDLLCDFEKIDESDVPVITMEEVTFYDDSFGPLAEGVNETIPDQADGFYGIWIAATKDYEKAVAEAEKVSKQGYSTYVCFSPEWEKMNADAYYCVTTGQYDTEEEAKRALDGVKKLGYPDAYIKHSGKHKYITVTYTNYGDMDYEVKEDEVILKNVEVSLSNVWYPGIENAPGYTKKLIIDRDTVFDKTCETEFFGHYEEGDTVFDWFVRNDELSNTDPEEYIMYGPALSGVFEIGINGDHVDRYFGSYWWD